LDQLMFVFSSRAWRHQLAEPARFSIPVAKRVFQLRAVLIHKHHRQGGHHRNHQVALVVRRKPVRREHGPHVRQGGAAGLRSRGAKGVLERHFARAFARL
jgi:hypothetical protein